jgi:hypothetical protein
MLYCQHPWLPNLRQLIELHRHITQALEERLAPEKKKKVLLSALCTVEILIGMRIPGSTYRQH